VAAVPATVVGPPSSRAPAPIAAPAPRRSLPGPTPVSLPLQADVLERRGPRVGVDQHETRLRDTRADPARPDELVQRTEPHAVVERLLDAVEQGFALPGIGFSRLLLEERLDIGIGAARVGAL